MEVIRADWVIDLFDCIDQCRSIDFSSSPNIVLLIEYAMNLLVARDIVDLLGR